MTHSAPNEEVAERDAGEGEEVAEEEIPDQKVRLTLKTKALGPDLDAELEGGAVWVRGHEGEEEDPGQGEAEGHAPNQKDDQPGPPFRQTPAQRKPNCDEPADNVGLNMILYVCPP